MYVVLNYYSFLLTRNFTTKQQVDIKSICKSNLYSSFTVIMYDFSQVKRCAEMSRKLRFFKDQIQKAGMLPSPRPASQPDIELEELEVSLQYFSSCWQMNSLLYYPNRVYAYLFSCILLAPSKSSCRLILNFRYNLQSTNTS